MSGGFWDFLSNPTTLNDVGTGIQAGGLIVGGLSHIEFGQQQMQSMQFRADQLRQQAGQEVAASQRSAWGVDLNTKYIASAALAAAAAGGGGGSDPGVTTTLAQIAQIGAYKKASVLYSGEDRARLLNLQADAAEYQGKIDQARSEQTGYAQMFGAGTTLLRGFAKDASLFQRFGGGGPGNLTGD